MTATFWKATSLSRASVLWVRKDCWVHFHFGTWRIGKLRADLRSATSSVDNPGLVELVGYAIGPQRPDEHISIEGFVYYGDLDFHVTDFHNEACECRRPVGTPAEKVEPHLRPRQARRTAQTATIMESGHQAWWVWWD